MPWIADIANDSWPYLSGAIILLQIVQGVLLLRNHRRLRARPDASAYYSDIAHAARLALVGKITASIVHEVTQPLSAILNNVETADLMLRQPNPRLTAVLEILADVRQDDLRAHDIVRRMRALLHKRELRMERIDINALISDVLALVRSEAARRRVAIRTAADPRAQCIDADPVYLQQVLLNLILNAMDAMGDTPPAERWLEVRTEICNEYLQVAVLDNGRGIAPAYCNRLFDSFFTTKDEGMGLGLEIARSIVISHGGAIWAESRETGGAAFMFTVPMRSQARDGSERCLPGRAGSHGRRALIRAKGRTARPK